MIPLIWFSLFALFILYYINKLSESFCTKKEIPEAKQAKFFRTINIYITILLISTYIEIFYTI
jgi:hypothetical protein